MTSAVWFLSIGRPGFRAEWDWDTLGAPDPRDLLPTRRPTSGDFSRHIPRRAYSVTTGGPLDLESGLEHDLLKWLDLQQHVTWLVSQPVMLHFPVPERRRAVIHTPDLLSLHADGSVTVWDARPEERLDELFRVKSGFTAEACRTVGWGYEIFTGLPTPARMNLLWLSGYRRRMPWHARWTDVLRTMLDRQPLEVQVVRAEDDGTGELVSTMWHLVALGIISCDLTRPIREDTMLAWTDRTVLEPHAEDRARGVVAIDAVRVDALLWKRLRTSGLRREGA